MGRMLEASQGHPNAESNPWPQGWRAEAVLQGPALSCHKNTEGNGGVSMGTLWGVLWNLSPWHLLDLKNRLKTEHTGKQGVTSLQSPSPTAAMVPKWIFRFPVSALDVAFKR